MREIARDTMATLLLSDEGRTNSPSDAGRLEQELLDSMETAVDIEAEDCPVDLWTVRHAMDVLEEAATGTLGDWTCRRQHLLTFFVDPAILTALGRRQTWPGGPDGSPLPPDVMEEMQRDLLEALDRPPILSDHALRTTAEALAWSHLRHTFG